MGEILDIYNESRCWVGTAPREEVHTRGLLHQVVHCWIADAHAPVLYFQQRAHSKADFPDYYDLACGGHIGAGEQPRQAVVREIQEETGLRVMPEQVIFLGQYRAPDLHLPKFFDREISNVFFLQQNKPSFCPGEEVSRMISVQAKDFLRMEIHGAIQIEAEHEGQHFWIPRQAWCCHDGEFSAVVLPYLCQIFPQTVFSGD